MIRAYSIWSVVLPFGLAAALGCKGGNSASSEAETAALKVEDTTPAPSQSRKFGSIAEKVVAQSAGVKEGDVVLVFGSDEDLPLLEDIAVQVRKQGASPIVTVGTNQLNRRMYEEVPAKYDTVPPEGTLKLAGVGGGPHRHGSRGAAATQECTCRTNRGSSKGVRTG